MEEEKEWWLYPGTGKSQEIVFPKPPPWRDFNGERRKKERGAKFQISAAGKDVVNAAIYLRRPLLVTGKPSTGKSTLAYSIAYELKLGEVLHWPINTRTVLKDGLYSYDAIGRLQDASLKRDKDAKAEPPDIGDYIQLGPIGTAFLPSDPPRVLLIDEFDKSDIDLPNDLLNIFEEGEFVIPELKRISKQQPEVDVSSWDSSSNNEVRPRIKSGLVRCTSFPIVILTSNGEREFPPAFLRRCLRLEMKEPLEPALKEIVEARLGIKLTEEANILISEFVERRQSGELATDQLLSTIFLLSSAESLKNYTKEEKETLIKTLQKYLNEPQ